MTWEYHGAEAEVNPIVGGLGSVLRYICGLGLSCESGLDSGCGLILLAGCRQGRRRYLLWMIGEILQ